jgi:alkylated DNA nucleotide flippase Atl1
MSKDASFDGRLLAEVRLHRRLAAAHDEHARDLVGLIGSEDIEVPELKGAVQRRIIALPAIFADDGLAVGEIARTLRYDEANTYSVLKSLVDAGVVEQVKGATPRRYRMAIKHRRNRVLRMSRLVPEGRHTTYGDFSIAVYDSNKMAITVGRVAAKNPAFAHPHRVLWSGGLIKDVWRDDEGRGPEECKRRLREEGVDVTDRRADPEKFIGWEELKQLLQAEEDATGLDEVA